MNNILKITTLIFLTAYQSYAAKNVMTAEEFTKIIGKSTSCARQKMGQSSPNACRCCLIKHASYSSYTPNQTQEIFDYCIKKGHCDQSSINNMNEKLQETGFSTSVDGVLQAHRMIKPVQLSEAELQRTRGKLDNALAVQFLQQAAERGDIRQDQDLFQQGAKCVKATILGGGGAQTLQLLMITFKAGGCEGRKITSKQYILKEMKKGTTEVKNLELIRNSPLGAFDSKNPRIQEGPLIAFDAQNLSYIFQKNTHRLSLINLASGRPYSKILQDLGSTQNHSPNRAEMKAKAIEAFHTLGKDLSILHKQFMQPQGAIFGHTYVHGDLHLDNVFYDESANRVVLIDNESFAISLKKKRPISVDLMKIYGMLNASFKKGHRHGGNELPPAELHEIVLKSFVKGYLSVYPESRRKEGLVQLRKIFLGQNALSIFRTNVKTVLNPIALKRAQSRYARPIFDELAREYS